MRILLITDEVWNDHVYGNNVLQNWFEGMKDVEFAQICCTPGRPSNTMCTKYFQLTDSMMLKSLYGRKAGVGFSTALEEMWLETHTNNYISKSRFYSFMKKISGPAVRVLREILWIGGRIDEGKLKNFVEEFNPDIVFCPRLLTWRLMKVEKTVAKYTSAPFVAFTADDEASLRQYGLSPIFWINRLCFRKAFSKHIGLYKHYFTFSADQALEYNRKYGVSTSTLYKSGCFNDPYEEKPINSPLRMVYAGRLYCNRWKTLSKIGDALKKINNGEVKIILDVFTQDKLTKKQQIELSKDKFINIKGGITAAQLSEEYKKADIALHVESLDRRNRLRTRVSFSTKIIDLMASSCAIMAICWGQHAGYQYLKEKDAAICVANYSDLLPTIERICSHPQIIEKYARKAHETGRLYHDKRDIQEQIVRKFKEFI